MSVLAPRRARTRRLASLLGGTALVSAAALSMAVTEASAACTTLFTGVVDCLANTTTTNSTNTNGATNPSSDRVQEFNNSANITPTITATVDGYGLQFLLTNAGSNSIGVINSGTVTTNQNVNALELNGNGALVGYIGTGTVSTTAGGGNAMAVTNIGAGGVTVINSGVFSSVSNYGLSIDTTGAAPAPSPLLEPAPSPAASAASTQRQTVSPPSISPAPELSLAATSPTASAS